MKYSHETAAIDELDRAILKVLQGRCRISNADLAREVNLSPPAVHARVKRLEKEGVLLRYAGLLDWEKVGYDMICFVSIGMQLHQADRVAGVRQRIAAMPEVLECYHVTGEYDYLLKVAIHNRRDLARFINEQLTPIPGVARIQTSMALATVKHETALPL